MMKNVINLKWLVASMLLGSATLPCVGLAQSVGPQYLDRGGALGTEAKNEKLILDFYRDYFNLHETNVADEVIREDYIQHNPTIASGRLAFEDLFASLFQQFPKFHTDIVRLLAAGDLVWVQSHQRSTPAALGLEIIDIYRIQDGKIAEHWDSIVPVSATPANSNTQF